jgi:hypothetical protein
MSTRSLTQAEAERRAAPVVGKRLIERADVVQRMLRSRG